MEKCASRLKRWTSTWLMGFLVISAIAAYGKSAFAGSWREVAEGRDCGDMDVGACTPNNFIPDPTRCGAGLPAKSAVCWNGTTFRNHNIECSGPDSAWCTYKTTPADSCTGGAQPGVLYECVETDSVPTLAAPGTVVLSVLLLGLTIHRIRRRTATS